MTELEVLTAQLEALQDIKLYLLYLCTISVYFFWVGVLSRFQQGKEMEASDV